LTFESASSALSYSGSSLSVSKSTSDHSAASQRFVLHKQDDAPKNQLFSISTAGSPSNYLTSSLTLTTDASKAGVFKFEDLSFGKGYSITESKTGKSLVLKGKEAMLKKKSKDTFKIFSVTY